MLNLILNNITAFSIIILQHENVQPVNKDFWFYFVYAASALIVLLVLILSIKYLVNPKEKSKNHIKRIILEDDEKNKNNDL